MKTKYALKYEGQYLQAFTWGRPGNDDTLDSIDDTVEAIDEATLFDSIPAVLAFAARRGITHKATGSGDWHSFQIVAVAEGERVQIVRVPGVVLG